ncbi:MAG: hypothetical protein F9K40_04005 [Kofleriaceae bacterium]|nr:MAG: hypothetical protein F9K40_04005 [Kofleriaceae bacterium]MBZ0236747.1 hypothetical protein [Kofleriaceae bacterium]
MTLRDTILPLLGAATLLGACGDDAPPDDGDGGVVACTTPATERYLPLVVGASWTYDTSDMGAPTVVKTSTVEALEDVGDRKTGVTAYRVRTEKSGTSGDVVSWQEDRCTSIVRHREQSFDLADQLLTDQFYVPGKLRVDETAEHTVVGATWTTAYTEVEVDPILGTKTVSKDETWTIEAVDEMVTTPAGTFTCLRVRKMTSGNADKTYWFAKGFGKIRETGEQEETLTGYTIP